jgi:methionyl-tRNA formyltransferase
LELAQDVEEVWNRVRAFNPFPGTSLLVGERRIAVDRAEFFAGAGMDGVVETERYVELVIRSRGIRLFKKTG